MIIEEEAEDKKMQKTIFWLLVMYFFLIPAVGIILALFA